MLTQHLSRVHPVDVIGAEDDHVVRILIGEDVEVLCNGICAACIPVRTPPHLRRHWSHVVSKNRRQTPGLREVDVQAVTLVLREDGNPPEVGIDQV